MKIRQIGIVSSVVCSLGFFAAPAVAETVEEHLAALRAASTSLVDLSDASLQGCADFSGAWTGTCEVKITEGDQVQTTQEEKALTIAQEGCQAVTLDGEAMKFNVATNGSYSAKVGFKHKSGAVYWEAGGQTLGFAKEVQGMLYADGSPHKKFTKSGTLTKSAETGAVQLKAKAILETATEAGMKKVKYEFSCPLTTTGRAVQR